MHPILFKIGTFQLHSYGAVMVVAFIAAIWLANRRADRYGLEKAQISDMAFWALVSGVLGARIVFILQDLPYYLAHRNELFSLQFQGLTSFGGLIFGAAAVVIWSIKHKAPIWKFLDVSAPAFVLGHAIGRIGCLLNGCCFGGVCSPSFPLGIHVAGSTQLHHPAQAYDTLMNLVVVGILLLWEARGLQLGQLTGLALIFHGTTRVIYEFWRAGTQAQVDAGDASSTYWGNLPFTQAQAMAALIVMVGVVIFLVRAKKQQPINSAATPAPA
jgi:phosphatidylglycerol---prolipoprotein diacylglyceryl transferase